MDPDRSLQPPPGLAGSAAEQRLLRFAATEGWLPWDRPAAASAHAPRLAQLSLSVHAVSSDAASLLEAEALPPTAAVARTVRRYLRGVTLKANVGVFQFWLEGDGGVFGAWRRVTHFAARVTAVDVRAPGGAGEPALAPVAGPAAAAAAQRPPEGVIDDATTIAVTYRTGPPTAADAGDDDAGPPAPAPAYAARKSRRCAAALVAHPLAAVNAELYGDVLALWGQHPRRPPQLSPALVDDTFEALDLMGLHVGDLSDVKTRGFVCHTLPPDEPLQRSKGVLLYGPPGTNKSKTALRLLNGFDGPPVEELRRRGAAAAPAAAVAVAAGAGAGAGAPAAGGGADEAKGDDAGGHGDDVGGRDDRGDSGGESDTDGDDDDAAGARGGGRATQHHFHIGVRKLWAGSSPQLSRPHPGETEELLETLFRRSTLTPHLLSCVFIDEIDSLTHDRKARGVTEHARAWLTLVLNCLDSPLYPNILLLGTTNKFKEIDEAMTRPGRMDVYAFFPRLLLRDRLKLLRLLLDTPGGRGTRVRVTGLDVARARADLALVTMNWTGGSVRALADAVRSELLQRRRHRGRGDLVTTASHLLRVATRIHARLRESDPELMPVHDTRGAAGSARELSHAQPANAFDPIRNMFRVRGGGASAAEDAAEAAPWRPEPAGVAGAEAAGAGPEVGGGGAAAAAGPGAAAAAGAGAEGPLPPPPPPPPRPDPAPARGAAVRSLPPTLPTGVILVDAAQQVLEAQHSSGVTRAPLDVSHARPDLLADVVVPLATSVLDASLVTVIDSERLQRGGDASLDGQVRALNHALEEARSASQMRGGHAVVALMMDDLVTPSSETSVSDAPGAAASATDRAARQRHTSRSFVMRRGMIFPALMALAQKHAGWSDAKRLCVVLVSEHAQLVTTIKESLHWTPRVIRPGRLELASGSSALHAHGNILSAADGESSKKRSVILEPPLRHGLRWYCEWKLGDDHNEAVFGVCYGPPPAAYEGAWKDNAGGSSAWWVFKTDDGRRTHTSAVYGVPKSTVRKGARIGLLVDLTSHGLMALYVDGVLNGVLFSDLVAPGRELRWFAQLWKDGTSAEWIASAEVPLDLPRQVEDGVPWSATDQAFALDTSMFYGNRAMAGRSSIYSVYQAAPGWTTRLTRPMPAGPHQYCLDVTIGDGAHANNAIMLGLWEDSPGKLANACTQYPGQGAPGKANGGVGLYLYAAQPGTLYDGRGISPGVAEGAVRAVCEKVTAERVAGRRFVLLLDTDPSHALAGTLQVWWNDAPGGELRYRGAFADGLDVVGKRYRWAVSTNNVGDSVSWRGYADDDLPAQIRDHVDAVAATAAGDGCGGLFVLDTLRQEQGLYSRCGRGSDAVSPALSMEQVHNAASTRFTRPMPRGAHQYCLDVTLGARIHDRGVVYLGVLADRGHTLAMAHQGTASFTTDAKYAGAFMVQLCNAGLYRHAGATGVNCQQIGVARAADAVPAKPWAGRRFVLLLDTDPSHALAGTVQMWWNDAPGCELQYHGVVIDSLDVVDTDWRFAIGLKHIGDSASWRGYADEAMPDDIRALVTPVVEQTQLAAARTDGTGGGGGLYVIDTMRREQGFLSRVHAFGLGVEHAGADNWCTRFTRPMTGHAHGLYYIVFKCAVLAAPGFFCMLGIIEDDASADKLGNARFTAIGQKVGCGSAGLYLHDGSAQVTGTVAWEGKDAIVATRHTGMRVGLLLDMTGGPLKVFSSEAGDAAEAPMHYRGKLWTGVDATCTYRFAVSTCRKSTVVEWAGYGPNDIPQWVLDVVPI